MTDKLEPEPKCPSCGCSDVLTGSVVCSDEYDKFNGRFFPDGLKFFALHRSVHVLRKDRFMACTACGCLWNRVDPTKLRALASKMKAPGEDRFAPGLSHQTKWGGLLALGALLVGAAAGIKSMLGW